MPPGKVITPLQKVFDCDHNRVPIPWMKFVISDKDEKNGAAGFVEDYDQNDEGPNKRLEGKDKGGIGIITIFFNFAILLYLQVSMKCMLQDRFLKHF